MVLSDFSSFAFFKFYFYFLVAFAHIQTSEPVSLTFQT